MKPSTLIKHLVIATIFVAGLAYVQAAWQPPTDTPPRSNVFAPVNTGPTQQIKTGVLGVTNLITQSSGFFGSSGLTAAEQAVVVNYLANLPAGDDTKIVVGGAIGAHDFCLTSHTNHLPTDDCLSNAGGGFTNFQVFNANGYWTVPSGVTKIMVEAWGGGQGYVTLNSFDYDAAGDGGSYVKDILDVTSGGYNVTIGAQSTGGTAGGNTQLADAGGAVVLRAVGGGSTATNIGSIVISGGDGVGGDPQGDGIVGVGGDSPNGGQGALAKAEGNCAGGNCHTTAVCTNAKIPGGGGVVTSSAQAACTGAAARGRVIIWW